MKTRIWITVNGQRRELLVDTRRTLLDVLRGDLGLMGTHRGCDGGHCGACTVHLNGLPVTSCLLLAADWDGADVLTIEGVAAGNQLHPLQQAMVDEGAVQCGYCTPGFVMNALALLADNPRPTEAEVRAALAGNLCRCTGYAKIVKAVVAAGGRLAAAPPAAAGARGRRPEDGDP